MQTVGETRHCWFYHTWKLRTSIIAHFASWNCPPLTPRFMTLSPRYLRSDHIHNTSHLLRQSVCFHSYQTSSSGTIYPKLLDASLSPLCLSNYVSTNTAKHPLWLRLYQWVPWAGRCWRCRCPSEPDDSETMLRQSTGLNTQHRHTHALPVSQPAGQPAVCCATPANKLPWALQTPEHQTLFLAACVVQSVGLTRGSMTRHLKVLQ